MPEPGAPPQIRLAGIFVGLEALAALVFACMLVAAAAGAGSESPVGSVLGEAGYFAIVGAALGAVAVGLVTSRRWARTPAIVVQLLLLPVVYSLVGPSHQLLLGVVCGIVVAATFLLLISEAAREWSMDLRPADPADREPPARRR